MTATTAVEDSMSSVSKALVILEVMALSDGRAIGVSDLAMVTDMPKSTAHRLLKAMEQRGFVGRTGSKYRVGTRCLQLSSVARWSEYGILLEHAAPAMEWLFERTGETVHLAVLDGPDALYLEKVNGRGGCRMRTKVGMRVAANTTAIGRVLQVCAAERGEPAQLGRQSWAAGLRATGALSCTDTVQPAFAGVAAPVSLVGSDRAVAALSLDGPVTRFKPDQHAGLVREAAARLSRRLGPYLEGTA
ncbi:IclR family transcriptional regulator [Sporichthya polymorpha]|uniref:IclR family transcriptional regulator n=1 Tax=Sporichthya polymorpha TaxID=35751 RepID=UPI00037CCC66|nr:IclR family transcriptional regulator [Sporichthya polymorpha]